MNHPRTTSFLKATAQKQKAIYTKIWDDIKNSVNIQNESSSFIFEYTEKGQIHLHGYITLYGDGHIMGAISDYVKAYKEWLPARHPFKEIYMYPNFQRYRDASICVQYAEPERLKEWELYMKKAQYINKNLISHSLFIEDAAKKITEESNQKI